MINILFTIRTRRNFCPLFGLCLACVWHSTAAYRRAREGAGGSGKCTAENDLYEILPPSNSSRPKVADVSKKTKENSNVKPSNELLKASYNAGFASGRLEAIEESMDTLAALIIKAETLIAGLGDNPDRTILDNANHTLRALQVAFAAVTGSVNGSAACTALFEQSKARLAKKTSALH